MDEVLASISKNTQATGGYILAVLVGLALGFQKLLNNWKGDKIDSGILDRLANAEKRMANMEITQQKQALKLTRLQVLVIKLEGYIAAGGMKVPDDIKEEIEELVKDEQHV